MGYARDEITTAMRANGWSSVDISEAFNVIDKIPPEFIPKTSAPVLSKSNSSSTPPLVQSSKISPVLIYTLISLVILAGAGYFVMNIVDPSKGNISTTKTRIQQPTKTNSVSTAPQPATFHDRLLSCAKSTSSVPSPFGGDGFKTDILGQIDGKCNYVMYLPNNGTMTCKLNQVQQKEFSEYYRITMSADNMSGIVTTDLTQAGTHSTTTVDGNVIENPLEKATKDGTCVISGY